MAIVLEADQQGDGPTTSQTGAAVHSRKLFTWRTTWTSGGQSLASTAHMGHEFTEEWCKMPKQKLQTHVGMARGPARRRVRQKTTFNRDEYRTEPLKLRQKMS